ncbi:MAG: tandem-95 repeat protein, partial [Planctomycetales bacterium]|nr:tandem-95 repeat protein [Planctomycetales bacterium]
MSSRIFGNSKRMFGIHSNRSTSRRRVRLQTESLEVRSLLTATLVADQVQAFENGDAMALDVLANDSFSDDYEGDRQITSVSFGSQGGRITINSDHQSLSYTPPADFAGEESFVYFVDNQFYTTVNVSIQSPLQDDEFTLPPDGQAHTLNVLGNDRFWDGYTGDRQITLVSTTNADSEVQISADGKSVMYTPSTFAQGRDQFVYIVDGKYSARATIDLTQPLRYDNYYILQNEPLKSYSVLANDPFWAGYSGAKQITLVSETSNGGSVQISADGRSIMYQPAADAYGWDSLTYVVDNTYEASASFNIQRPVQDDYTEIDYESSNQPISVLTNDYYYDHQTDRQIKIVQRVTDVQSETEHGGSITISANGQQVLYTPAPGFSGSDSFTYTADGRYPASVTVQVTRPVRNDSLSTYQDTPNRFLDVLSNDFLGNGYKGAKQITSVSDTESGGTIRLDANRLYYTPAENFTGGDSFTYVVDGELEASVYVYVQPLASYDSYSYCVNGAVETYTLNVLANDNFQFGYPGPSQITAVEASDGWAVSTSADGQRILATPSSSSVGELTYTVDNNYTASVYVYRTGHLSYDYFLMDQNSSTTTLNVLQNDFQNNHPWDACRSVNYRGAKRITSVSGSEHGGTVAVSADGRSIQYSPPTDFVGTDSFTYIVDGQMEATASVNVIQRLLNDEFHVASGQAEDLGLLHNDSFSGGYTGAQKITDVSASPSGAQVSISSDGRTIRYQAAAGFHGSETLVYTVDDQ